MELSLEESKVRRLLHYWPLMIAASLTVGFAIATAILACQVVEQDDILASRWQHFLHGTPNEIGDTLAGFVGSLTLIWIIVSVVQQSMELKAQREEFKKMVLAQDAQVRALHAQAKIFEDERRHRSEKEAGELFNTLLEELAVFLRKCKNFVWTIRKPRDNLAARIEQTWIQTESKPQTQFAEVHLGMLYNGSVKDRATADQLGLHFNSFSNCLRSLTNLTEDSTVIECPSVTLRQLAIGAIGARLKILCDLEDKLSMADRVRFKMIGVSEAVNKFESICALPYWDDDEHTILEPTP